jgi:hypothetical protein
MLAYAAPNSSSSKLVVIVMRRSGARLRAPCSRGPPKGAWKNQCSLPEIEDVRAGANFFFR